MNHHILTIIENTFIAKNTYKLLLRGPTLEEQHPGRFVNLQLAGRYLRRPISVCDSEN